MEDSYKVLKCGNLYVKEIVYDGYDQLASLTFSKNLSGARRIDFNDATFDGIEERYNFLIVKTIIVTEN